jgi:hypothetical protein
MAVQKQAGMVVQKQPAKAPPQRPPVKKTFTMQHLWRTVLWGATAASALLLAVLTTRSEVGEQRVATVFSSWRGNSAHAGTAQVAAHVFDAQAETRRLSETMRGLAAENDQLKARLAAIEHNVDDMTGSIARQVEAVKAQAPAPWPAGSPPATMAPPPAVIASVVAPVVPPPSGLETPLPSRGLTPSVARALPGGGTAIGAQTTGFGVDIGSALSIQALRTRWLGIHAAHPQLFEGLTPSVMLREIPRSDHVELRLVVGPMANAEAAARLCASLLSYRVFCQPTVFDGAQAALQ